MDRKTLLKSTAAMLAAAACAPISMVLEGCAPSGQILHVAVVNRKAVVPLASLPALAPPNSYAKLYLGQFPNPVIMFALESGEIGAVLSTCSHSGCEVKKLRTKFECPCHGSEYDLQGNVLRGLAPAPLETFNVQKFSDRVEFLLEGPP
ncbi:MAG: Rieske 2Fe-2S domain-containing protein [Bacteroidota bacterium]